MGIEVTGYVYYARIGRSIKIGYANNVKSRMSSYPPETELLAVEPGSFELEAHRLSEFADALTWGNEWFEPSKSLMNHIGDLRRIHGAPEPGMEHQYTPRNPRMGTPRMPNLKPAAEEWLSVAQAADELAVNERTIRRWISQGRIEGHRIGPKLIRVRAASLRTMGKPLQYVEAFGRE